MIAKSTETKCEARRKVRGRAQSVRKLTTKREGATELCYIVPVGTDAVTGDVNGGGSASGKSSFTLASLGFSVLHRGCPLLFLPQYKDQPPLQAKS